MGPPPLAFVKSMEQSPFAAGEWMSSSVGISTGHKLPHRRSVVLASSKERSTVGMRARFEELALSLHPDKTRLLEFGRHAATRRRQRGPGKPEAFTFPDFTFICGKTRSGKFLLKRKSRGDRVRATLRAN